MGAIRNMNWTRGMRAFIVCGLGRGLSIERTGARRGRLTSRVSPCFQVYANEVVSAFAGAVPALVRSPENCPPFRNRSNQT